MTVEIYLRERKCWGRRCSFLKSKYNTRESCSSKSKSCTQQTRVSGVRCYKVNELALAQVSDAGLRRGGHTQHFPAGYKSYTEYE